MARKFRKRSTRIRRVKPRGRRRLLGPAAAAAAPAAVSLVKAGIGAAAGWATGKLLNRKWNRYRKNSYNASTANQFVLKSAGLKSRNFRIRRSRNTPMVAAAPPAEIHYSPGLTLGTYKPMSFAQKVLAVARPPITTNAKWTFQMDCVSGRVSGAQIPILTQDLLAPILGQFFLNALTDTGFQPGDVAQTGPTTNQYNMQISSYHSKLRFYNSSTNTLRARIVWYRPKRDLDSQYETFGANTYDPLNMLMLASNVAEEGGPFSATSQSGVKFTAAEYNADYNHAGWPITGTATTSSHHAVNTVAQLDPSLVPGSAQVKRMFSNFWETLKAQDFTLSPGHQFNTSVTLKNRIVSNMYDDMDIKFRRKCCIVGVVYVIGQMVFSDLTNISGSSAITTGSSQLSVMREDSCTMRPQTIKRTVRCNLTNQFVQLASSEQGIINTETDDIDITYNEDT